MFETGCRVFYQGSWCDVELGSYKSNNNTALVLTDTFTKEEVATATINPYFQLGEYEVAIKDHDENEGIMDALTSAGVLDISHSTITLPYNIAFICRLGNKVVSVLEDAEQATRAAMQ